MEEHGAGRRRVTAGLGRSQDQYPRDARSARRSESKASQKDVVNAINTVTPRAKHEDARKRRALREVVR